MPSNLPRPDPLSPNPPRPNPPSHPVYMWRLITKVTPEEDWPDKDSCTHAAAMSLWIKAQTRGLRYDTAVQLIFDFGVEDTKVLGVSEERAQLILENGHPVIQVIQVVPRAESLFVLHI